MADKMNETWQGLVGRTIDESPTKWAMMSPKQRNLVYSGFVAGYRNGKHDGEEEGVALGEQNNEYAAAYCAAVDPQFLHDWALGYFKSGNVPDKIAHLS